MFCDQASAARARRQASRCLRTQPSRAFSKPMSHPAFSLSSHLYRRISSRSARNSLYSLLLLSVQGGMEMVVIGVIWLGLTASTYSIYQSAACGEWAKHQIYPLRQLNQSLTFKSSGRKRLAVTLLILIGNGNF